MAETAPELRRLSEDSVRRRTGKGWAQWLAVLDDWGGRGHDRAASARHLRQAHGLSPRWAEAIATRYADERGLGEPR